jgi:5-methyltetrahydropteroyltriglutamate--homocysteine methyltransferase
MAMSIPSEPIGSIPRPASLLAGIREHAAGRMSQADFDALGESAVRDTIAQMEATGSPVITDGEQTKVSFATYPIAGLAGLAPDGVTIPFADGHVRRLPRLITGPFRYATYADAYLCAARKHARLPVKQAVISASALSLLYPQDGIKEYPREAFVNDLLREHEADIRRCLGAGAHKVQIDFTEGRLSLKLDPSQGLLDAFVGLNNQVLARFTDAERARIGVHVCPGGDQDSTHSADVDYAEFLPGLFRMNVGNFYLQLASEKDRRRVLKLVREHVPGKAMIFVGVTDPISPRVESAQEVRDRVLEAAEQIPHDRLGTTDDCGFSPFGDDTSTSREIAFAKIRARIAGTEMAAAALRL